MAWNASSNLTCAILFLSVWVIYRNTRRPHPPLPPGPKGYPIIGNALQLDVNRPWHTLVGLKKAYGDIVHLRLFNQNVIVLNSAKAAGDILDRRAANYSERPRTPIADYMLGGLNIIFMNHGSLWRSMRRAVHEALNMRAMLRYQPIQMRVGLGFAIDLLNTPEKYLEHTHLFSSHEIASIVYNDPKGQHIEDLSKFVDIVSEAVSPGKYLVNHFPILEYVPEFLAKWKRYANDVYRTQSERYLSYYLPLKKSVIQKEEIGPSFCATLVENQEQHGLSELESAWLSAVLYTAGFDTTAGTLGWLILAMITFPEAQRRAQEEIDNVIGRTRVPTLNDMEHLPYTRAVVKEVLRWRPPAPMGVFHASKEDDIYEGYYIPKGTLIIPNILSMNHDIETYGPNTDKFCPERFLNEDGTHKLSPPDTKDEGHYSFGFGRRVCPGRHLAINALHTFAIVLWAMHLESGKPGDIINTNDEGTGILSRAPRFTLSSKPRFPEALDLLKLANEDWC
ncbi:hypothetical protein VNI00_009188 [Paramarasmius palmivorus]|uniref:Cytochrome P450 n=1 Tax=Paramarasmius palmivorus TaxID=297713 RepID=A0AAW0CR72_9AGAR